MTVASIPRLRLAHLPTPIEPLPRLSAMLGGPRLFIKRDDQIGLALGGNKTRKLEFVVAEAQAQGARTLVTAGAWQSNHCRQTAAAAARCGMDCILVLTGERPVEVSGNLLLDRLLDARIVTTPDRRDRDRLLKQTVETAAAQGQAPYLVPYGGSSATGALGYAYAMREVLAQGIEVDWMVFATSSGGTQAGLVLGQRIFGYRGRLLGISIDEPSSALASRVAVLASDASAALCPRIDFDAEDVHVEDRYCGPGYGVMTGLERDAIRVFARSEGILLDPVYTGRAAGGVLDLIRRGFFPRDARILFWHTGGQPALFAEPYRSALGETRIVHGADAD
jgi:D-cysteine desulfhydrase family pyridoxal phosphate-dependent enzyme